MPLYIQDQKTYILTTTDYRNFSSTIPDFVIKFQEIIKGVESIHLYEKLADLFYQIFRKYFICTITGKRVEWYIFRNHRWFDIKVEDVREFIIDTVRNFCSHYFSGFAHEKNSLWEKMIEKEFISFQEKEDFELVIQIVDLKIKSMNYIIDKVHGVDPEFQNKLYLSFEEKFYNLNFVNIRDTKPLLCFENGVLDLISGTFRNGKASDCCTQSCNFSFEIEKDEQKINKLNKFLEEIFPDPAIRYKFLTQICYSIFGKYLKRNPINRIPDVDRITLPVFLVHFMGNGMSTTVSFIKKCFGDYVEHISHKLRMKDLHHSLYDTKPKLADKIKNKKILFINDKDLETTFKIIDTLEDTKGKFFILGQKNILDAHLERKYLEMYPRINFESKFISKDENKFTFPMKREDQLLNKTFDENVHMGEELEEYQSAFISLILKHRLELLK